MYIFLKVIDGLIHTHVLSNQKAVFPTGLMLGTHVASTEFQIIEKNEMTDANHIWH